MMVVGRMGIRLGSCHVRNNLVQHSEYGWGNAFEFVASEQPAILGFDLFQTSLTPLSQDMRAGAKLGHSAPRERRSAAE